MKVDFSWNRPMSQIAYERSGGDKGRLFLAEESKRLMDPYVPANDLVLAQNVRVYVENQNGVVHYNSPYAHYQHEGVLFVSSRNGSAWARQGEFKVKASPEKKLEHSTARHSLATSHWDKAMMIARKSDLARAYQNWLNRRRQA